MLHVNQLLLSTDLLGIGIDNTVTDVILVIVVLLAGLSISRYVTRFVRTALGESSAGEVSIVVNIIRVIVVIAVVYVVGENVFHIQLGGILQALGITTLVVSLGMQDLIKNVVAGIQIVVGKLFGVGDQIEVGDSRGEVLDISWRQTTMRDKDGDPHVIPNALLMSGKFMRRDGKMARRYDLECDIKPGLDLDRVAADIQQLADAVLTEKGWKAEENTEVRFIGSTANGVRASIRIYLTDIEFTTRGYDAVMRAIDQRGYLADWTNDMPDQEQWR